MNIPFVFISIFFILGILISYCFKIKIICFFILFIIVFSIYIILFLRKNHNSYLFLVLISLLGIGITSRDLNSSILKQNTGVRMDLGGVVDKVIWDKDNQSKYIIKINSIGLDENKVILNENTSLKIIGKTNLEIGDKICFSGVLNLPIENTNPYLYNQRKNLLCQGIHTSITIKDNFIENINKRDKSFKYRARISFERHVDESLNGLYKANSDLMKGIILGNSSYLEDDVLSAYRNVGLAHILAVSGLHIGIIAGFLTFILSRLGVQRKINIIFTLIVIWIYGYLIGFPPSILRANIMFSLLFLSQMMFEPYDSINTLFLALFILLVANPLSIFHVGFQLSFIATFSIIYFFKRVRWIFYPYNNKLTTTLSSLISLYIGILPVQLHYFNSFSAIAIISNIVIAPLLSLALIMSTIIILIPLLKGIIGFLLNIILNIESYLVGFAYKSNFLVLEWGSLNAGEFILYFVFILILFKIIDIRKLKINLKQTIYYYLIFIIISTIFQVTLDKSIQIDFIEIGQGDSSLMKTQDGNYLLDTGGNMFGDFDIGENITLPYLKKHGINSLKGVFISHFDLDHCKGLIPLMENINIGNILISYKDPESEIYNEIINSNIPVTLLVEGDLIYLDDNTKLEIIYPLKDNNRNFSPNNLSMVFNLSYYDKNILFTGDIENEVEALIVDKIGNNIDILKVAHHGSKTSSTKKFLDKVNPNIGIISSGRNNSFGHPNKEVLDRFDEMGTKIYRTDTMGMIRVKLDKYEMSILPFLNEQTIWGNYIEIMFIVIYNLISYIMIKNYVFLEGDRKHGLQ